MRPIPSAPLPEWLRSARHLLQTHRLGQSLLYLPQTDSTNALAQQWLQDGAPEGGCVVTDDQTAGRGRSGRRWLSEPDANLTFSAIVRPDLPLQDWPLVGLAVAVAVARTLESFLGGRCVRVKWPNDVLIEGRKAAGILLESSRDARGTPHLIVGVGVNVNQAGFPDEIGQRATSLYRETGTLQPREAVFALLIDTLEQMIGLCAGNGISLLLRLYTARLYALGETVTFYQTGAEAPVQGRLLGLSANGALRISTEEGEKAYHAGELTTHAPA